MSVREAALILGLLGLFGVSGCGSSDSSGANGDAALVAEDATPADARPDAEAPPPDASIVSNPDAAGLPVTCASDAPCESEAYCSAEGCVAGCRIEPDNCRNTPAGLPQRCDATSHVCAPAEAPPTGCTTDEACIAGRYCDATGHCSAGCRLTPGDCGFFDTCDPISHTCRAPRCADDLPCPEGTFCDSAGLCAAGCGSAADCESGLRCDDAHRCRSACAEEADCGAGQYCDPVLESCRVDCTLPNHQGCQPEEACDAATHRCVSACRDDVAESGEGNDTPVTASPLNIAADANRPGVFAGAVVGRILCPGDPDYLSLHLPNPARTEVVLTWDTRPGDLTLDVSDVAGMSLGQVTGTSPLTFQTASLGETGAGTDLVVGVSAAALAGPAAYGLSVRTAAAETGCFPDAHDPIDDRPANGRAAGLRPEALFIEQFEGSTCRGDVDWICFDLEANDGLRATLEAPAGAAHLSLGLYTAAAAAEEDSPAELVAEPIDAPTPTMSLTVLPESALLPNNRYCVRVAADQGAPDGQAEGWRLTLDFQRSGVRCADPAEPNDTAGEALALDGGGVLGGPDGRLPAGVALSYPVPLRLCPGDTDVFRFDADAGDVVRAWIEGGPELGSAEVSLLDPSGRARGDLGAVTPAGEVVPSAALAVSATASPWYVRVRAGDVGGGEYTLHVRRDTPGEGCSADFQETAPPNDTPAAAGLLSGPRDDRFTVTNARLCSDLPGQLDEDWYRFSLAAPGNRLCMSTEFRQREGNVDLELYRADSDAAPCADAASCEGGQCIEGHCVPATAASRTLHDGEMLSLAPSVTLAGDYYLRVFSSSAEQNAYDLAVTRVAPSVECGPDFRERDRSNDDSNQATPLGAGRAHVCDAWLCRDERQTGDWYRINVPAGEDRTVHVGFDGLADGTVAVTLLDPNNPNAEVFVAEANTIAQCLNVRGGPDAADVLVGLTAVRLADDGDSRLDYTLQVAPTNLSRGARGECDALNGGLYREIPWPTHVLGL